MDNTNADTNFSTEKLVAMLEKITEQIRDESISKSIQENLWDTLNWDKHDPENKEIVKYLFTGWWIHQNVSHEHA